MFTMAEHNSRSPAEGQTLDPVNKPQKAKLDHEGLRVLTSEPLGPRVIVLD